MIFNSGEDKPRSRSALDSPTYTVQYGFPIALRFGLVHSNIAKSTQNTEVWLEPATNLVRSSHLRVVFLSFSNNTHTQFGFVYIFNLIIGVGALTLPKAFSNAGLALGTILIFLLCFVSYMTATYMIEAMAAANAYAKLEQRAKKRSSENTCPSDVQKINQVQREIKLVYQARPSLTLQKKTSLTFMEVGRWSGLIEL